MAHHRDYVTWRRCDFPCASFRSNSPPLWVPTPSLLMISDNELSALIAIDLIKMFQLPDIRENLRVEEFTLQTTVLIDRIINHYVTVTFLKEYILRNAIPRSFSTSPFWNTVRHNFSIASISLQSQVTEKSARTAAIKRRRIESLGEKRNWWPRTAVTNIKLSTYKKTNLGRRGIDAANGNAVSPRASCPFKVSALGKVECV